MIRKINAACRASVLFLAVLSILVLASLLHPAEVTAQKTDRVAAASPGGTSAADLLTRVIEGAKREGVVDAALQSSLSPRGIAAVQDGIRKQYGIDLKINYTPTRSYPRIHAQALTELKAGAPPSFDLITLEDFRIFALSEEGGIERVDWGPLLLPRTPPEVAVYSGSGLVVNTTFLGLLYNPKVISSEDAPSSLKDLTNPKWRGKVLVPPYTAVWMPLVIPMGRQASLSMVDGIMKNGAVVTEWPTAINRFTLGEFPLVALISETFAHQLKAKGLAVGFKPLDAALVNQHIVAVRAGARHPNAAKLLAAFLAGPEALKIWQEIAVAPNFHYRDQSPLGLGAEWRGVRPWFWNPERLRYSSTPEVGAWEQEIGRVLTH